VLEGAASYDALPSREQALVRAAWLERSQALAEALDLEREFAAAGYRYAEADASGRVAIHEPRAGHGKRVPRRAARR
jgi:hypothetical protein